MSDLPPIPPPPPPAKAPRSVGLWVALAVAVALLVGVGATAAIVLTGDQPAAASETVLLEHAADTGPDPFVSTVAITAVPTFPDEVRAVSATTADGLAVDPATGTRTAAGTTDALYGGSGELGTCDPDQLVDFLAANPAPAAAWAGVHDIAPDRIGDYVANLTPVVLLHDTAVTNYGFNGGVATPRQSVLQAGTAVLVDPTGTPAVRCACGNPLTAPVVRDLPAADLQGTRWDGFDPAAALTVTAGPRTSSFTLVDIATGQTYQRPAGLASLTQPALLAATPAGIQRSTDGQQWSVVGAVDQGALTSLDASPDLVVAAGGTVSETDYTQHSGVILTSTDGTTWSAPTPVQDYVVDVAYGNGSWLAIGMTPMMGEGQDNDSFTLVTYRSTDGARWERQQSAVTVELGFAMSASSVVFGNGTWLVDLIGILGDGAVQATLSSTDGVTWAETPGTGSPGAYTDGRAFNGQQWGITGSSVFFDNGLEAPPRTELKVGGSADGVNWLQTPGTPTGSWVGRLSCTADRGWLAIAGEGNWSDAIRAVHTSADLVTWSPLGTSPDGGVTDVIAVGAGTQPDAAKCGTPAGAAPAAAGPGCDLDRALGDGRREIGVVTGGELTCDEMRSRWTAYWDWTGPKLGTAVAVDFGDGWGCSIVPLSAQLPGQTDWGWDGRLGDCAHTDGRGFAAFPEDRVPGSTPSGAATPAPTTTPAPAPSTEGDLGVSEPISQPACDGTGIVVVASSIHPESYAADVQAALDQFPGSRYLRTDLTGCSSLNQVSSIGTKIYAVYRPVGTDVSAICAEAGRTAGYGKWLDNTTSPTAQIGC